MSFLTQRAPEVFAGFSVSVRQIVDYHPLSRTAFRCPLAGAVKGRVAVVSAGTADGPVTWEAARTLTYLGINCAPGIGVLNIDNGYGAACAAARVVNLLCA